MINLFSQTTLPTLANYLAQCWNFL